MRVATAQWYPSTITFVQIILLFGPKIYERACRIAFYFLPELYHRLGRLVHRPAERMRTEIDDSDELVPRQVLKMFFHAFYPGRISFHFGERDRSKRDEAAEFPSFPRALFNLAEYFTPPSMVIRL